MKMFSKSRKILGSGVSMLLSTVLLVGMLQSGNVVADPSASLSKSGKAEVGKTISVNVSVSGDGPYGGYNGSVGYDSSYLELQSISAGNYGAANFGKSGSRFLDYNCNIPSGSTIVVIEFLCVQEGSTTISVDLNVSDLEGLVDYGTGTSATIDISAPVVLSGNNYLSSLSVAPGSLSPSFSRDTQTYYVTVGENQTSIAVSASAEHGSAKVSLNGVQNDLQKGDNTVKVTVTAENGETRTYKIIVTRGTPTPTPEPYPLIESNGNSYTILEKGSLETVPAGFSWSETTYKTKTVPCLVGPDGTLLMWLLSDSGNGLYLYDLATETVSPCYAYSREAVSMMFLAFPSDFTSPAGYEKTTITIDEHEIEAYKCTEHPDQPLLVYLLDAEGHEGLYYLDEETNMIIPFRGDMAALIATPTPLPTDTPTPSPSPTPVMTFTPSPTIAEATTGSGNNGFKIATIVLSILCAALLGVMVILLVKRNKDNDEYVEEENDPDTKDEQGSEKEENENNEDHYYQFGDEPEPRRPGAKQAGSDLNKDKTETEPVPDFPEFPEKKVEKPSQPVIPTPMITVIDEEKNDAPAIEGSDEDLPAIESKESDIPALESGEDVPSLDAKDFAGTETEQDESPEIKDISDISGEDGSNPDEDQEEKEDGDEDGEI